MIHMLLGNVLKPCLKSLTLKMGKTQNKPVRHKNRVSYNNFLKFKKNSLQTYAYTQMNLGSFLWPYVYCEKWSSVSQGCYPTSSALRNSVRVLFVPEGPGLPTWNIVPHLQNRVGGSGGVSKENHKNINPFF